MEVYSLRDFVKEPLQSTKCRVRDKRLTLYAKLMLKDQFGDSCLMFSTSFSYGIFDLVPRNVKGLKMKTANEKCYNL